MAFKRTTSQSETEDDMIQLGDLTETTVLENLRTRYYQDNIYTSVGDILVTVNPFKLLPIYSPEVVEDYLTGADELPPHVFQMADRAYKNMRELKQGQALIIAGDSGAGKTETAKLVMHFLVESSSRACGMNEAADARSAALAEKLMLANKVLEAFGNAKTSRNNNSSRFGKWTEIIFDNNGQITGGKVVQYLLEKTRVCSQAKGERNYHVFYQLIANSDQYPELELKEPKDYAYLNKSGVTEIPNVDDKGLFEELVDAMDKLGFTVEHLDNIRKTLAGLLLLGNVEIVVEERVNEENGSKITNKDVLEQAAKLLGIQADSLEQTLLTRLLGTHTVIRMARGMMEAQEARDALVQSIYGKLFTWLIEQMNVQLCLKADQSAQYQTIGVLDIFGFECFEENSFEQLCINYCNEKLQKHFTEQIVQVEMEEYKEEGVPFDSIEYKDNSPTLALLDGKPSGILPMIQEEMNSPGGSNDRLLEKVCQQHQKHARFAKSPRDRDAFTVKHYAADVKYRVSRFLEKNTDDAPSINTACDPFMEGLFTVDLPSVNSPTAAEAGTRAARVTRNVKKALGVKFQGELSTLLTKIQASSAHFVRCIKPNGGGLADTMENELVASQLAACGLIDCIKVRASGYVGKYKKADFVERFACVTYMCHGSHPTISPNAGEAGLSALTKILEAARPASNITNGSVILPSGKWAVGKTKVYLKQEVSSWMAITRRHARDRAVTACNRLVRGFLARKRFAQWRKVLETLKAAMAAAARQAIEEAIEAVRLQLPSGALQLPLLHQAAAQVAHLIKVEAELARLQTAIDACPATPADAYDAAVNRKCIEMAISSAVEAGVGEHPVLAAAQELLTQIQAQQQALVDITALIEGGSAEKAGLLATIGAAEDMGLVSCKEVVAGHNVVGLMEALDAACDSAAMERIIDALRAVEQAGVTFQAVAAAESLRQQLLENMEILNQLESAIRSRSMRLLNEALQAAEARGLEAVHPHLIESARAEVKVLELQGEAESALVEAVLARDLPTLLRCIQEAQAKGVTNEQTLTQAHALKEQLEREASALERLAKATLTSTLDSMEELAAALTNAAALSLEASAEVTDARARMAALLVEQKARAEREAKIKKVLGSIEELEMDSKVAKLSEAENERLQAALKHAEELGIADHEEVVKAKTTAEQLEKVCADPTKGWQNYPGMRSGLVGERKILRRQEILQGASPAVPKSPTAAGAADAEVEVLTYDKRPLKKPLTALPNIHCSSALAINRSILVFMGDRVHTYPSTAAVDLLKFGVRSLLLANETYVQLMRQLTENTNPMSERNGWKLLCICARSFAPSEDLMPYLISYVEAKSKPDETGLLGATGLLAKSALRSLTSAEPRGKVLKLAEIDAWRRMLWNLEWDM